MLSDVAIHDRMWGPYPALRKVLERKCLPDEYYGYASVSDNVFQQVQRTLELALLVHEYKQDVLAARDAPSR